MFKLLVLASLVTTLISGCVTDESTDLCDFSIPLGLVDDPGGSFFQLVSCGPTSGLIDPNTRCPNMMVYFNGGAVWRDDFTDGVGIGERITGSPNVPVAAVCYLENGGHSWLVRAVPTTVFD
jgi:hypothetical protein